MPFRLIQELKPEMWTELESTQRQAKLGDPLMNLGHCGSVPIAEIGNGKFHGRNSRAGRGRSELAVREEVPSSFVELDAIVLELSKQLTLAHATQANCPDNLLAVWIDGNGLIFALGVHAA
jgi:hypothetical protein